MMGQLEQPWRPCVMSPGNALELLAATLWGRAGGHAAGCWFSRLAAFTNSTQLAADVVGQSKTMRLLAAFAVPSAAKPWCTLASDLVGHSNTEVVLAGSLDPLNPPGCRRGGPEQDGGAAGQRDCKPQPGRHHSGPSEAARGAGQPPAGCGLAGRGH